MAQTDTPFDRLAAADGELLDLEEYGKEFYREFRGIEGVIWKLERAQTFDEGDHPSWRAMLAGEWERSLALLEEARDASRLPEAPTAKEALHDLIIRARLGRIEVTAA